MKYFLILFILPVLFSCETKINPVLDDAEKIIVVDAWVNQKMERQEIRINRSQPYFENSFPVNLKNAIVNILDLNTQEIYHFSEGTTSYYWDPIDKPFGEAGHSYRLTVYAGGETFEAFSTLGRVPEIDSISFNYNPADMMVKEPYFTAEFLAADPAGVGDAYWIKTFKNGNFLSKPSELNIAFDAGFTAGQSVDGQVFLLPIRNMMINPYDEVPGKKNEFLSPYAIGDTVEVEIYSINPLAFEFLWGVYSYINRPGGFAELFSAPLANAITNIKNTDKSSKTNVAGFFNVSSVSSKSKKLTKEIADLLSNDKN
jgi:hypothetical protein